MRPIDADDLKITLTNWIRLHWDEAFTADDMAYAYLEMINEELTLKMKPVVHAHWIKGTFADITCSNCDFPLCVSDSTIPKLAYCPHCGAKMDEEEEK